MENLNIKETEKTILINFKEKLENHKIVYQLLNNYLKINLTTSITSLSIISKNIINIYYY
jgi:hypothetical protein